MQIEDMQHVIKSLSIFSFIRKGIMHGIGIDNIPIISALIMTFL